MLAGPVINFRHCLLRLRVANPLHPADAVSVDAIIDTGATNSVGHATVARRLGLPVLSTETIIGVSGPLVCTVVMGHVVISDGDGADLLSELTPMPVVHKMADDMLYGMDLLKGGVLTVDMVRGRWRWVEERAAPN